MIKGGAETPQSPQTVVGVDPGQHPAFYVDGDSKLIDLMRDCQIAGRAMDIELEVTRRLKESMGVPDMLLTSGPASGDVKKLFGEILTKHMEKLKGQTIEHYSTGACGIATAASEPRWVKYRNLRHFRVVVSYLDEDSIELAEIAYRSLRVAKVDLRRRLRDRNILYVNYSIRPIMPVQRFVITGTVDRAGNTTLDALCNRLGVEPSVMQQIAKQEGADHALNSLGTRCTPPLPEGTDHAPE